MKKFRHGGPRILQTQQAVDELQEAIPANPSYPYRIGDHVTWVEVHESPAKKSWTIEGREVSAGDKLYDSKYGHGLVEVVEEVDFFGTPHLRARYSTGDLGLFIPSELSWSPRPVTIGSLGSPERMTPDNTDYFSDMAKRIGLDPVNRPPHYTNHPSGIECIQITEHMTFCLGNAVKYIWRADLKHDAVQDLEKAKWYIEREIVKRKAVK